VQLVDTSHSVRGIGVSRVGGRSGDTLDDVVVGPGSGNNLDRVNGRDGREGSDGIDVAVSDTGRKGEGKTLSVRRPEERVEEDARNGCSDEEAGRIEGRLDVVRETSPLHVRLKVLMDVLGAAKARLVGRSAIGTRPALWASDRQDGKETHDSSLSGSVRAVLDDVLALDDGRLRERQKGRAAVSARSPSDALVRSRKRVGGLTEEDASWTVFQSAAAATLEAERRVAARAARGAKSIARVAGGWTGWKGEERSSGGRGEVRRFRCELMGMSVGRFETRVDVGRERGPLSCLLART
jgi:hypothetical protein